MCLQKIGTSANQDLTWPNNAHSHLSFVPITICYGAVSWTNRSTMSSTRLLWTIMILFIPLLSTGMAGECKLTHTAYLQHFLLIAMVPQTSWGGIAVSQHDSRIVRIILALLPHFLCLPLSFESSTRYIIKHRPLNLSRNSRATMLCCLCGVFSTRTAHTIPFHCVVYESFGVWV